jgi:hypothetical protein
MHQRVSCSLAAVLASAALAASTPLAARGDDSAVPGDAQRNLGFMVSASSYTGFGGGVSFGTKWVGLRAGAGWAPIMLTLQNGNDTELKFYSAFMVSPDLYVRLFGPRPWMNFGLQGGYRYNSILGSGFAASAYGQFRFSPRLDGLVNIGFLSFADGENEFRKHEDLPANTEFGSPGPSFIFAAGFTLLIFP